MTVKSRSPEVELKTSFLYKIFQRSIKVESWTFPGYLTSVWPQLKPHVAFYNTSNKEVKLIILDPFFEILFDLKSPKKNFSIILFVHYYNGILKFLLATRRQISMNLWIRWTNSVTLRSKKTTAVKEIAAEVCEVLKWK